MKVLMRIAAGVLMLVSTYSYCYHPSLAKMEQSPIMKQEADNTPLQVKVILKRQYIDGETSEEVIEDTILSMEDFWEKYVDWQLVEMGEAEVVFHRMEDDISPLLKTNGYFGVSEDGTISIFNGTPDKAHIIQSFFQIDVKKLEGSNYEQLKKGIPVKSKTDYHQVLEALKSYSFPDAKK